MAASLMKMINDSRDHDETEAKLALQRAITSSRYLPLVDFAIVKVIDVNFVIHIYIALKKKNLRIPV